MRRIRTERIELIINSALKSFAVRQEGFSVVELAVVAAVIVMLTILLFPRFAALTTDARQSELRQDARSIQAAIELLKIERRFDSEDERITEVIEDYVGRRLSGRISALTSGGSFIYTKDVEGYRYQIAYDDQKMAFVEPGRRQLVNSE